MYAQDDLQNLTPEEKKKMRNSIQMEIIMLESDMRKKTNERDVLEAEIRKLKRDEERLRIDTDEKKKLFEQAVSIISEKEAEIKRLRKRLNLIV